MPLGKGGGTRSQRKFIADYLSLLRKGGTRGPLFFRAENTFMFGSAFQGVGVQSTNRGRVSFTTESLEKRGRLHLFTKKLNSRFQLKKKREFKLGGSPSLQQLIRGRNEGKIIAENPDVSRQRKAGDDLIISLTVSMGGEKKTEPRERGGEGV